MFNYDDWKTTPPDDKPIMVDTFENEIYKGEEYCELNDWILSRDTLDDLAQFVEEDDCECAFCGCKSVDDFEGRFYLINGDWFCEGCVEDNICTAGDD